jgi:hypothetical protein
MINTVNDDNLLSTMMTASRQRKSEVMVRGKLERNVLALIEVLVRDLFQFVRS